MGGGGGVKGGGGAWKGRGDGAERVFNIHMNG